MRSEADGVQTDALLSLVTAWGELTPEVRDERREVLHANPVIVTERLRVKASAAATDDERRALEGMLTEGLVVIAEDGDTAAARTRLAHERPGYLNRAARRKLRRPRRP